MCLVPEPSGVHLQMSLVCVVVFIKLTQLLIAFSCRVAFCFSHLFLFQKYLEHPINIFYHTYCRYNAEAPCGALELARNNTTHPSCRTANRSAKVMVQERYESSCSINKQPLFRSPAKYPHLPEAASGDEASLPGGRQEV